MWRLLSLAPPYGAHVCSAESARRSPGPLPRKHHNRTRASALLLARAVTAPRFHQIVGAALPLLVPPLSAALVCLPGLPPLPTRAVALFAAVRHARGLLFGRSSRTRSKVAAISVPSSPITSEKMTTRTRSKPCDAPYFSG